MGRLEDVSSLDFYAVQKNHEYRKEWDKLVIDIKVIERNEAKNEEVWQWISSFPVSLIDVINKKILFLHTVVSGISDTARDRKNSVGYAEYRICRILIHGGDSRFFQRYLKHFVGYGTCIYIHK